MAQTSDPPAHAAASPGAAEAARRKAAAVMAASARIPPARLAARAHGCSDPAAFQAGGRAAAMDIFGAVDDRISLEHRLSILDFGCGCARTMRFMAELAPSARFHGSDPDGEAVSWCLASYPLEVRRSRFAFTRSGELPPLALKSDSFDLVYSSSAFLRLAEGFQLRWLAELRRVAKPDGLIVLATPAGAGAAHARAFVDSVWPAYFHVAAHVPAGSPERGSLVVAVKRRPAAI